MISIKMLLLVVMITFSSVLSASTAPKNAPKSTIHSDIAKRLEKPTFILEKDVLTNVTIVINKNNEIVVLSVDTENEEIIDYIKSRLNYTKVSESTYNKNIKYIVPIRLHIEK